MLFFSSPPIFPTPLTFIFHPYVLRFTFYVLRFTFYLAMAKIEYSALVNRMRGRLSHGVMGNTKGTGIIKRHSSGVHQPGSAAQHDARGFFSDLKGQWYNLGAAEKELWNSWVAMSPDPMSGLNAFLKHNQRLHMADHAQLPQITTPAPTPSTPPHVQGIEAWPDTTQTTIQWTAPLATDAYVQVYYAVQVGYSFATKAKWSLVETVRADVGEVIHTHDYPTTIPLLYRARSIDAYGRISPFTHRTYGATLGAHYDEDYYDGGFYA